MTADEIAATIRDHIHDLRAEADALEDVANTLSPPPPAAPYGYAKDGTPRRRPALSADAMARAVATRRAKMTNPPEVTL